MFSRVAIDFHLHFYNEYDPTVFFQALYDHLADPDGEGGAPLHRVAILTEAPGCDAFQHWAASRETLAGGYSFAATAEPFSLALTRNGERLVLIVKGRQIVTTERLEVLSAGNLPAIEDGWPLADVVDALTAAGVLAVIPWGAGKWIGRRGRLVEELISRPLPQGLFLADNPARPAFWPVPRAFRLMEREGRPVLRGSDPLPLPGEEKRAGAFATRIEGEFDPARPLASVTAILEKTTAARNLGRRDGSVAFLRRQIGLRLRS